MSNIFDVAVGTATGYSHVLAGTANQDAYAIRTAVSDSTTIMVVADGCSEGHHSEVGARVGANVCAEGLRSGADAIDAFVARGGVDLPVQEPKAPPSKISPKPKVKKAKGEKPFQFADRQPNAVCEACDTPGHTAERCPENA